MKREVIVAGASAGGIDALIKLMKGLPADLNAAVFVVVHLAPSLPSLPPQIVGRHGSLPAMAACDGRPIRKGHVYLAPPDYHLMLNEGQMRLWHGPRENRHRPSINVLFRSAAEAFGSGVIGAVLSGSLDDGSAGLWWVKQKGGLAVVQNPETALFSEMPANALSYVDAAYVADASAMGPLLSRLTEES